MSNDNGIADALRYMAGGKMSDKLTFRELMKKYGDGEINEETKIKFIDYEGDTIYENLGNAVNMHSMILDAKDFEIVEEKKKVFEYKCCNNNNFRALKDCTIQSLESFTFITNLTWEEFNDRENKKFYLLETREIEI